MITVVDTNILLDVFLPDDKHIRSILKEGKILYEAT